MVKSLGKSIINMYSMEACAALGISNQDALSEDLENNPFLNSSLKRFTWEFYYRFGLFLAPLSAGIITSRHYLSEHNKNGERTSGTSAMGGAEALALPHSPDGPRYSEVLGPHSMEHSTIRGEERTAE